MAEPELALKPLSLHSGCHYAAYDATIEEESLYRSRGPAFPSYPTYAIGGDDKPVKKARMGSGSGGLISRLLGSGSSGCERRGQRVGSAGL
jgi:hypothetical protein